MQVRRIAYAGILALWPLLSLAVPLMAQSPNSPNDPNGVGSKKAPAPGGELLIRGKDGQKLGVCPLQHTAVDADLNGFVGRTRVRQTFKNPLAQKIEALYVFPLPQNSALDGMTMIVGKRRIVGQIKTREQARQIYETAKAAGKVAGLLDQQRPNVFTQAVANIEPGAQVIIEINYTETIKLEDGVYEWVFPMTVGPRYAPSGGKGKSDGAGTVKANPAPPATIPDHSVSLNVEIDAGMAISEIASPSHKVAAKSLSGGGASVTLSDGSAIPNKDFILRYRTGTDKIEDAFLTHTDSRGTYFTLVLQPPRRVAPETARPKELIFVVDRSGSMSGFALEKARETMRLCIENMNPRDTFNLMSFSFGPESCFDKSVSGSKENREIALRYLESLDGEGGTDMLPAVLEALSGPPDAARLRVVCFMTDGYVDNDFEIIAAVKKYAGAARVFSFGIGSAVNRFLLDGIALAGRGEVEYVTSVSQAEAAAKHFYERIDSPVLTNIKIDWGALPVAEIYPKRVPDLFSAKPLTIHGRLNGATPGTITLRGVTGAGTFERKINVALPKRLPVREALASLWARAKVSDLMAQDLGGLQNGTFAAPLKAQIIELGLDYHLITQFTSFVAVDEETITKGGPSSTVRVPSRMPEGVTHAGILAAPATPGSPASSSGAGRYRMTPSRPMYARRGDPLISIEAPASATQVIAIMPGGEIKRLRFNSDSRSWEARFDIPDYADDGEYAVQVIVVFQSGDRRQFTLHYHVDTAPPSGTGAAKLMNINQSALHLSLEASADTDRVEALLPDGQRIELQRSGADAARFEAWAPWAARTPRQAVLVTFILTDKAHNRTTVTVDMSK